LRPGFVKDVEYRMTKVTIIVHHGFVIPNKNCVKKPTYDKRNFSLSSVSTDFYTTPTLYPKTTTLAPMTSSGLLCTTVGGASAGKQCVFPFRLVFTYTIEPCL
jgi:hypothetical protein